jgi:hypothetical protein
MCGALHQNVAPRQECLLYVTLEGHPLTDVALATVGLLRAELQHSKVSRDQYMNLARQFAARALLVRAWPTAEKLVEIYATRAIQLLNQR